MNARLLVIGLASAALGFGAGAWWMQARLAPEIAELEAAASQSLIADLAKLGGAVPGPQLPPDAPRDAAATKPFEPTGSPAPRAPTTAMVEPPASWMSIDQQRAAAFAYRESVRDANRQAWDRVVNLNAELFLIEGQDPGWATAMEAKVRASLGTDPLAGATLESIECRVTVCRAMLRFPEADSPQTLRRDGRSPWSEWRNAQIVPLRNEVNDGVPGFRATVYLGDDFDQPRLPRGPRTAGPGGP